MKVVVDCRYIRLGPPESISRNTVGLVTALAERHPITVLVSDLQQLRELPELPYVVVSDPTRLREPWVARQVNQLSPDVVFTPIQTIGVLGASLPAGPDRARPHLLPSPPPTGPV